MKQKRKPHIALAEPDEALLGYLQTLLDEIPEEPESAVVEAPPVTEPEVKATAPAVKMAPETPEAVPEVRTAPAVEEEVEQPQRPDYLLESFQALSFKAAGATFSLPLLDMKSIVPLSNTLTHLPGHPDWHMGVLLVRGDKVGVVDLTRLLHGASAATGMASGAETAAYVLMLDDGRWGLACQSLGNAFEVEPENVRWRQNWVGPRYIRGVLRDSMTPLLNCAGILERLEGSEP